MSGLVPSMNSPTGPGSQPKQANIAPETFRSNLIDTKVVPISDIITAIRGTPWTSIYYAQVLGQSQQPLTYQDKQLDVYQQYTKINNLVLAVQNQLDGSQDPTTTEFTVTGTAVTYPHFVPTKFDHFFAPIRDGRLGLFVVTSVTRKSIYDQSAHEIEYELIARVDNGIREIFDSRVVKELYFNMELLRNNNEPFLTPDENKEYRKLAGHLSDIGQRIYRWFFDGYLSTLQLPDQLNFRIIDQFHLRFYQMMYGDTIDAPTGRSYAHYRTESLTAHTLPTLWNLLANRTMGMNDMIVKVLKPLNKNAFARYIQYGSVFHSQIDHVMFPVVDSVFSEAGQDTSLALGSGTCGCPSDGDMSSGIGWFTSLNEKGVGSQSVKTMQDPLDPSNTITIPYIKPVTIDEYYVFSEDFYTGLTTDEPVNCSLLEIMALDYLKGRPLSYKDLNDLVNDILNWSTLQHFYYLPVLAILIKSFLGDI